MKSTMDEMNDVENAINKVLLDSGYTVVDGKWVMTDLKKYKKWQKTRLAMRLRYSSMLLFQNKILKEVK